MFADGELNSDPEQKAVAEKWSKLVRTEGTWGLITVHGGINVGGVEIPTSINGQYIQKTIGVSEKLKGKKLDSWTNFMQAAQKLLPDGWRNFSHPGVAVMLVSDSGLENLVAVVYQVHDAEDLTARECEVMLIPVDRVKELVSDVKANPLMMAELSLDLYHGLAESVKTDQAKNLRLIVNVGRFWNRTSIDTTLKLL